MIIDDGTQATSPRQELASIRIELTILTCGFVLSQFYRSYVAVIAPELIRDLHLSHSQFGAFSSVFFFVFAVAQVPLGILFDHKGVAKPITLLLGLAVLSAFVLASAPNFSIAICAQATLGLACAPLFMGLLHFTYARLDPQAALRVTAMLSAIGTLGSLLASIPLGWTTALVGWRVALRASGIITLVIFIAAHLRLSDRTKPEAGPPPMISDALHELVSDHRYWTLVPICLAMSMGGTLRTAWAGPYLSDIYSIGVVGRGNAMTVASLVGVGGAFLMSALVRRASGKRVALTWIVIGIACGGALASAPNLKFHVAMALISLWFAVGGIHPLVMSQARTILPPFARGIGLGILNACVFAGIAVASNVFGLIWQFGSDNHIPLGTVYSRIFLAGVLPLGIAAIPYLFSPDVSTSPPQTGEATDQPRKNS